MKECCSSKDHHGEGCCCHPSVGPELWSRGKKIRVLEHYLECLDKKREEVKQLIKEHKDEMK